MNHVKFDPEKCIGCELCSDVCSLNRYDEIRPAGAAIRISRETNTTFGEMTCRICSQCEHRRCIASCPLGAIKYDEEAAVVRVIDEFCEICECCQDACPNINVDNETRRVVICNHCEGDPLCAKWCPEGALSWEASA